MWCSAAPSICALSLHGHGRYAASDPGPSGTAPCRDGLEESIVHPSNASKADHVHELSDLCHRNREIGALQNGGAVRSVVRRRNLKRKVVSCSPPTPDLAQMIAAPRPGTLAVRPHLNRPGRWRCSVVAQ